jgi:hypothetical protein
MGSWAAVEVIFNCPLPAGVVGFDVLLHCMRACMDPRLERISPFNTKSYSAGGTVKTRYKDTEIVPKN